MQFLKPKPGTVIADLPTVRCAMAALAPGSGYPQHRHPASDEVYLFLEGQGEIMEMDCQQVEPFDAPMQAMIPAGTPYALKNTGTHPLKLIWALAPNETPEMGQIKQRYQNRHRILPQTLARFSPRFLSQLCRFASVVS